ncbi:MAG: hypothetical protein ACK56I_16885, partial [bacterium]
MTGCACFPLAFTRWAATRRNGMGLTNDMQTFKRRPHTSSNLALVLLVEEFINDDEPFVFFPREAQQVLTWRTLALEII